MLFGYKSLASLIFTVALTASVTTTANTNEKRAAKPAKGALATVASVKWVPEIYDPTWTKLPPGYMGTNLTKVSQLLESVREAKKGEFETNEQFNARFSDVDTILVPINRKSYYAFKIDNITHKYDADFQVFRFWQDKSQRCSKSDNPRGWMVCQVARVDGDYKGYEVSNSFGASRHVRKYHEEIFGLALPLGCPALDQGTFGSTEKEAHELEFFVNVPVPIEKAKLLKAGNLGVLFVGKVQDAKQISVTISRHEPTWDELNDEFVKINGVQFDVKKIVVYVVETGEILNRQDFD